MKNILLTGSSGFIGSSLVKLLAKSYNVYAPTRNISSVSMSSVNYYQCENFHDFSFFPSSVNIDCVIHVAGAAHNKFSEDLFFTINVDYTLKLFEECRVRGLKRFLFLSSIGVNGNYSNAPFSNFDVPNPSDPYSKSKFEAEEKLKNLCLTYGIEFVIIRPPLVYGKSAPGNFGSLERIIKSGFPLPFGLVNNKRSFVHLDNLNSLILNCITNVKAANQIFLVSDGNDLSTSCFLKLIIQHSGSKTILVPIPLSIFRVCAFILGRKNLVHKITCDLQVDITYTMNLLGWRPIIDVNEGLKRCFVS